jgi:hypothetical protein
MQFLFVYYKFSYISEERTTSIFRVKGAKQRTNKNQDISQPLSIIIVMEQMSGLADRDRSGHEYWPTSAKQKRYNCQHVIEHQKCNSFPIKST